MIARARLAFGNARVRARAGELRGPAEAARRRLSPKAAPAGDRAAVFAELVAAGAMVRRSFPGGEAVVAALVRLHEVENLKLARRACARSVPERTWLPLWRPLGELSSLDADGFRGATLESAAARLRPPWRERWEAALPAGGDANVEIGWDRWATRELAGLARRLPVRSREILAAIARERDLELVRRAKAFDLPPAALSLATALLPEEIGAGGIAALHAWRPGTPMDARVARRIGLGTRPPSDWGEADLRLRRRRRALCRRAFLSGPFSIDPAVAYLVLKTEEVRSVEALDAFRGGEAAGRALANALAAGPMEA